jgi:hypothetical protein
MIRGVNRGTDDSRSRESLPIGRAFGYADRLVVASRQMTFGAWRSTSSDGAIAIYGAAAPADTLQPASDPRRSW